MLCLTVAVDGHAHLAPECAPASPWPLALRASHALLLRRPTSASVGHVACAKVCSSFAWVRRATTKRSWAAPLGNEEINSVRVEPQCWTCRASEPSEPA